MMGESIGKSNQATAVFVDPPYTVAGKRAGKRLYNYNTIDHQMLFRRLSEIEVDFLMTYDHSPEIMDLIRKYEFHVNRVNMKNTHHAQIWELLITRNAVF